MNTKGKHFIADIWLNHRTPDADLVYACHQALKACGLTVVDKIIHVFQPQGVTAIWILKESHFAMHTYPEHRYVSIDCYTCGDEGNPGAAVHAFLAQVDFRTVESFNMKRGDQGSPEGASVET